MKIVVFVTGSTAAGKTTLLDNTLAINPLCMGCFVGRTMRQRHPPEYFNGLGAQDSTEPEVRDIFSEKFTEFEASDATFMLVDGMPRLRSQVRWVTEMLSKASSKPRKAFYHIEPTDTARRERMRLRGGSAAEMALAESRFLKDKAMYDEVYDEMGVIGGWRGGSLRGDLPPERMAELFGNFLYQTYMLSVGGTA